MKNFLFGRLSIAILFLVSFPVTAQTIKANTITSKIEAYLQSSVAHQYFSGNVLIAKNGKVIFHKAYGMANYELSAPNQLNTVFRTGSITKQFTSMAVMQLKEKGKLGLSDTLGKFLANCPVAWKPVTLHQLLTHTSGIPNFTGLQDWDEKYARLAMERSEIIDLLKDMPLQFVPGQKHKYCNTGYMLLSMVIEKVSGMNYHDYLSKNIFEPLGMKNTSFIDQMAIKMNRADGYATNLHEFVNAPYGDTGSLLGSGSVESTTSDLLLWNNALHASALISKESTAIMFTPALNEYAYGHRVSKKFGLENINHSGSDYGFSSYIVTFPGEQLSVIVLSNSDKTSAGKIGNDLAAIVLNQPYKNPEASLDEILSLNYKKSGAEAAIATFKALKDKPGFKEKISDEDLNNLGYEIMERKKLADAVTIFKFNTLEFPESSYAYDLLGEAFFQSKDYAQALLNFKKALELNKDNEWAIRGIKKTEKMKP